MSYLPRKDHKSRCDPHYVIEGTAPRGLQHPYDMGVNHGRLNALVAQEFLDLRDVGAVHR